MFNYGRKKISLKERLKKNAHDIFFCIVILLFPTVQFIVFYLGVNLNTVALSFRAFDYGTGYVWCGFDNFRQAFYNLFHVESYKMAIGNSLLFELISIVVGMSLSMLFAYYIYLKKPLAGFFKSMMFMPSVVSSIVLTVIFRIFVGRVYSEVASLISGTHVPGLLSLEKTRKATLYFYNIFFGFGTTVLLYSGAMSGTNESVMEYAEIDGANYWQKFFHVMFPMIFPTFITFIVMHVSDTFMNQMNLLGFYGTDASYQLQTFGYYLYTKTLNASLSEYPLLATYGLIFTAVTMPIVFTVKWLLKKYGPDAY